MPQYKIPQLSVYYFTLKINIVIPISASKKFSYTSKIFVMTTLWLRKIGKDTWKLIISRDLNKKKSYLSSTAFLLAVKSTIMSKNQSHPQVNIQGTGWKSNPKLFKWALVGVIFAGVSYLIIKKYRRV